LLKAIFYDIVDKPIPRRDIMKNDKHTSAIPEATITQIHGQIAAAIQTLAPYTIALTAHERQTMLKMGDKSLAFVEKPTITPMTTRIWSPVTLTWGLLTLILRMPTVFGAF
jgi:hypothetical protein